MSCSDRVTGEEWIVTEEGAYIPEALASIVKVGDAIVLTDEKAVHLRATVNVTDSFGKVR